MCEYKLNPPSFKDWMQGNFELDELSDIAKYGAQSGFHGLIYYTETCALYDKYHDDIWNMLDQEAFDQGVPILNMIASFNGARNICDDQTFKNLLVWFSAEMVAYGLTDNQEE